MTKQAKAKKKISRWRIAAILVVVLLLGWLIQVKISQHYDGLRFAEADKKKQQVFGQLLERVGPVVKTEEEKTCYNSEQGPFDNGRLWCQTTSATYLQSALPRTTIDEYFSQAVKANGYEFTDQRVGNLEFEGERDLPCELIIYDGMLAPNPGFYLTGEVSSKQTIIVRCSDRAKAKHYSYIDY